MLHSNQKPQITARASRLTFILGLLAAVGCLYWVDGTLGADDSKPADAKSYKDLHGDALPQGAIARGGTVRFRHRSSAVAYSPDGKILASGGHDNQIRLFDAATGKEIRRLAGHQPRTYKPDPDPRSAI
jgi:WD40 repeat protein